MKKIGSTIILTLLLIGILMQPLGIQPVKAAMAAVYINANGSVSPSTAPIQRNGSIYTLTGNITSDFDGIWIKRSNVILDGAGYTISGNATVRFCEGICLQRVINVTIRNVGIKGFSNGIDISESQYVNIIGNGIIENSGYGIWLLSSSNNNIRNNMILSNWIGLFFSESSSNSISGNNISGNSEYGIGSYDFSGNSIVGNSITNNEYAGISFYSSSNNSIARNLIRTNNYDGIVIGSSSYNRIVGNNITENSGMGIRINDGKYTDVSGNGVANNSFGIGLFSSSYNSIAGNRITENYANGVWLSQDSSNNTICGNNIAKNNYGVSIDSSSNNLLYHNVFINNGQQVDTYNSINVWDDDYPSGGNYWSDYMGVDSNNDGIGDIPYIIELDNVDKYPHMKAWDSTIYLYPSAMSIDAGKTFDVSIMVCLVQNLWAWQVGIQWDPTILQFVSCEWGEFQTLSGTSKQSMPTIDNAAGKTSKPALESALRGGLAPISRSEIKLLTITFKVVKAGTSSLRLMDVSLASQNSTSITPYPRWSDVNVDGVVDDSDVTSTFRCWEGGYYNQTLDFNNDGTIDIADISIVTSDFGKNNTDPEWSVTNTVSDISTATVGMRVLAQPSEAHISVPYHYQLGDYFCGPAALEMLFDFYGPDISQFEIADVARTTEDGTYTFDMLRAAHFSNLSTSATAHACGYTARKLGYAAFECGGMTIDDLKSLILAGYPIIVLTTWHFRVAVGYDSTYIILNDPLSYRGPNYKMTYDAFDKDWDYSGHWGLFVSPWSVRVHNPRNVLPGDVFEVTATITYPCPAPFQRYDYPATMVDATITMPTGLNLVSGETAKKAVDTGDLVAGGSVNVTWTVQANSLGNYAISVESEGRASGFVPPIPPDYPDYNYEDRIGGSGQAIVAVTSCLDESPPTTIDNYDGLWHNQGFRINLTATDDVSGVMETYYRINEGPMKILSLDGQPYINTEGINNTLEYWSVDWAGNEEFPHKLLLGIKFDKTSPKIKALLRTPSGNVLPNQEVKVTVNVTDTMSGVKNVTLLYTITNGTTWESQTMNYNVSTCLYETTIHGQSDGSVVKFKVVAYDLAGDFVSDDNLGKYYMYLSCSPLVVAIQPLSISTWMGHEVTFTSTITGGIPSYRCQWYLNGIPVLGATSNTWVFKPTESGIYSLYLEVLDAVGNATLSETARIKVTGIPVGGYSVVVEKYTTPSFLTVYIATVGVLTIGFTVTKLKTTKKRKKD